MNAAGKPPVFEVARLDWRTVGERLKAGASAILPIGAGAKEHGLHLPMATDQIQAEALARQLAERLFAEGHDLLIWPAITYGYYPAFQAYAGSVSLSAPTFRLLVQEVASQLLGFGARNVFVLDTGISTMPEVKTAIAGLSTVRHLPIHAGPRYRAASAELMQQPFGGHADELETSRMLVIAPDAVNMSRAVASPVSAEGPRPGALNPFDRDAPNYSPSGSFGDPTLATQQKGEVLLAAMLDDLAEAALTVLSPAMPR